MKQTKENIYINLQGKSVADLEELYQLVKRDLWLGIDFRDNSSNSVLSFEDGHFIGSSIEECKELELTEVTIQQLKEILQPMENTKFKKGDKVIITDFGIAYSDCFTLKKPYVLAKDFNKDNGFYVEKDDNNHINNGWFNAFDLGIKIELYEELSLTEQIEKAKAEVERLQKAIEENKIKIGDWVYIKESDTIFNVKGIDLEFMDSRHEKITDQELINKLNKIFK